MLEHASVYVKRCRNKIKNSLCNDDDNNIRVIDTEVSESGKCEYARERQRLDGAAYIVCRRHTMSVWVVTTEGGRAVHSTLY